MTDIDEAALAVGLAGGLALFLFGLDIMTRALKRLAGDYLKTLLGRMTENRFSGLALGAIVTAVIQSSSVTTVLVVGFISAGMMTTAQSVAVILGANIGTTITAQILAFNVTALAMPILTVGFFVSFAAPRDDLREYGSMVLGLGLVFFGMATMGEAVGPLRTSEAFTGVMLALDTPLLAALVGAVFTAVVQSSSATTGILIALAAQGLIGLEPAIALALGANIGTCATALLAAIGKPRAAVRAALVHTLLNVAGVVIWIGLIGQLADLARAFSPVHPELQGLARDRAELPRQIANVHTLFNVANALFFIGFTRQVTAAVEWLLPQRPPRIAPEHAPKHLDEKLLGVPAIALDAARLEIVRLGGLVQEMMRAAFPTLLSGSPLQIDRLSVMDRPVDLLHREIVGYLRQISLRDLSTEQSERLMALIRIANDFEHIGDQIATGMAVSARKRIDENVVMSMSTAAALTRLHDRVLTALRGSIAALEEQSRDRAAEVRAMKEEVAEVMNDVSRHQLSRLRTDEPLRLPAYAREIEMADALDDIFKTVRRIARSQLDLHA